MNKNKIRNQNKILRYFYISSKMLHLKSAQFISISLTPLAPRNK